MIAENFDLSNFRLDLKIKLEESEHSTGRPKNIKEIIESIDSFSMPEVLIYRPFLEDNLKINMFEFYRSPLLIQIGGGIGDFKLFYKEYRTYDFNCDNESFTRWLNFIYQK